MTTNHIPDNRLNPAYDPHSMNTMFGIVLTRMDGQDKAMERQAMALERIEQALADRVSEVEEEVESLSMWRSEINGKIVIISLIVSGAGTIAGSVAVAFLSKLLK